MFQNVSFWVLGAGSGSVRPRVTLSYGACGERLPGTWNHPGSLHWAWSWRLPMGQQPGSASPYPYPQGGAGCQDCPPSHPLEIGVRKIWYLTYIPQPFYFTVAVIDLMQMCNWSAKKQIYFLFWGFCLLVCLIFNRSFQAAQWGLMILLQGILHFPPRLY